MQVGTGQRINVTMFDFSYSAAALRRSGPSRSEGSHAPPPPPTPARTCRVFATIREPARGATTTTVCDSRGRVVHVFTSDADRIELRVMTVPRAAGTLPSRASSRTQSAASRHDDAAIEPDSYVVFHYAGQVSSLLSSRSTQGFVPHLILPSGRLGIDHPVLMR